MLRVTAVLALMHMATAENELHRFAADNNVNMLVDTTKLEERHTVEEEAELKAKLEDTDSQGRTPLMVLMDERRQYSKQGAVEDLARKAQQVGARCDIGDAKGRTQMGLGLETHSIDLDSPAYRIFHAQGCRIPKSFVEDVLFVQGGRPSDWLGKVHDWHFAAQYNELALIDGLGRHYGQEGINEKGEDGNSALHVAASQAHIETVAALLAAGAGVGEKNRDGYSPLHVAASVGHVGIVDALLDAGADIDEKTAGGRWTMFVKSSVEIALDSSHVELAEHLKSKGATMPPPGMWEQAAQAAEAAAEAAKAAAAQAAEVAKVKAGQMAADAGQMAADAGQKAAVAAAAAKEKVGEAAQVKMGELNGVADKIAEGAPVVAADAAEQGAALANKAATGAAEAANAAKKGIEDAMQGWTDYTEERKAKLLERAAELGLLPLLNQAGANSPEIVTRAVYWCEEQGAQQVNEIVETPGAVDDFVTALQLKPFTKNRLLKAFNNVQLQLPGRDEL